LHLTWVIAPSQIYTTSNSVSEYPDRKSTRLNSSHVRISYAVFCLKKKVKRSDRAKGFVPLPKRWIVERTIAWLNRCRRLAKDWENLNRSALAFLKLASIRLMLRKLCNPS